MDAHEHIRRGNSLARQIASRIGAQEARVKQSLRLRSIFRNAVQPASSIFPELAYAFLMRCFFGFDGGGTKTECVLMDESAKVVARTRSGPSNPSRIGVDAAANSLRDAASLALREAGAAPSEVQAICAGLAGTARAEFAEKMRAALADLFPGAAIRVLTDYELALAMVPPGPAIVLVAGTGSVAFGRRADGKTARAGGFGPAASDEGSAFDVGRAAMEALTRDNALETNEPPLTRQILRQLGCANWEDVQARAHSNADAVFPRIFPVVAAAADAGDSLANSLLTAAARNLRSLAKSVAETLGIASSPFSLALTGGMLGCSTFLDGVLDESLHEAFPQASAFALTDSPAEAAARLSFEPENRAQGMLS
ncbi:MAG TPA: BadF/BadG/BcrA/BcrD ATPase family protein [Terriglobales bacterium]|nr:BadF/BadG/BcrA/BcrD ATPase family protein [Terriglobales bacterium]